MNNLSVASVYSKDIWLEIGLDLSGGWTRGAVLAGWVAKLMISSIISAHIVVMMFGSAVLYLSMMMVVYTMPWVAGLEREEIESYLS